MASAGTPNSSFFVFDESDADAQYRKYDESVAWPAISMATVKPNGGSRVVVAIGPNGDYWELQPFSTDEAVGSIPGFSGNLRKLAAVDNVIIACGMGRAVLARRGVDDWISIGPAPRDDDANVIGFEDIDGFGRGEMYAVGWGGEIWTMEAGNWRRVDSPTTSILTSVYCAPDGFVYVAGHDGLLLKGRGDDWQIVDTQRDETIRDIAMFGGVLFAVTDYRILKLTGNGLIEEADFSDSFDRPATCLHLLVAPDGLMSVGTYDVYRMLGGSWIRLV